MAESDTWEGKENLGSAREVIEEYEKEYQRDMEDVKKQKKEEGQEGKELWRQLRKKKTNQG